jgi:hypothetical protein
MTRIKKELYTKRKMYVLFLSLSLSFLSDQHKGVIVFGSTMIKQTLLSLLATRVSTYDEIL